MNECRGMQVRPRIVQFWRRNVAIAARHGSVDDQWTHFIDSNFDCWVSKFIPQWNQINEIGGAHFSTKHLEIVYTERAATTR